MNYFGEEESMTSQAFFSTLNKFVQVIVLSIVINIWMEAWQNSIFVPKLGYIQVLRDLLQNNRGILYFENNVLLHIS